MVWDDTAHLQTCFHTYSDLLCVAETVARALSALPGPTLRSPVAIYGKNCPSVLTAILAVMSLRAEPPQQGARGVACLPVDPDGVSGEQGRNLWDCGVQIALVEESAVEVRKDDVRTYHSTGDSNPLPFFRCLVDGRFSINKLITGWPINCIP
jgi:acyl-CoA synthetase (AMP-forming)/AMP-acid ligase II